MSAQPNPAPKRPPNGPQDNDPRRSRLVAVLAILAVVVALGFIFRDRLQQFSSYRIESLLYMIMAAMLVGGGLWARGGAGGGGLGPNWLRNALLWAAIIAALTLVVSAFGDFSGFDNYP